MTPLIWPAHVDATSKLQMSQPSNRTAQFHLTCALQRAAICKHSNTYLCVSIDFFAFVRRAGGARDFKMMLTGRAGAHGRAPEVIAGPRARQSGLLPRYACASSVLLSESRRRTCQNTE